MSAITERVKIFTVTLIRITGSQLHAARVLVGLSRGGRACRALPPLDPQMGDIQPRYPGRDVHAPLPHRVLEREGARFTGDNGVSLQRPAPVAGTVVHSEAAASTARTSGSPMTRA